jgi:hypothetical protein
MISLSLIGTSTLIFIPPISSTRHDFCWGHRVFRASLLYLGIHKRHYYRICNLVDPAMQSVCNNIQLSSYLDTGFPLSLTQLITISLYSLSNILISVGHLSNFILSHVLGVHKITVRSAINHS